MLQSWLGIKIRADANMEAKILRKKRTLCFPSNIVIFYNKNTMFKIVPVIWEDFPFYESMQWRFKKFFNK